MTSWFDAPKFQAALRRCSFVPLAFVAMACQSEPAGPSSVDGEPANVADEPEQANQIDGLQINDVQWPDQPVDQAARASLSRQAREVVDRTPMPVWVPLATPEALERGVVTSKPLWYAYSSRYDGITVSVHGKRAARHVPGIPAATGPHRVRGQAAFLTENEGVWSATWNEAGLSLTVEVECDVPADDPRCADESFVATLAEQLVFVGGRAP